jgi:hypothetical protein
MKLQLTTSKSSRDRYYLVNGSMGSYGCSGNHVNNQYEIVNGIDKGNGYQGYTSVSYFLTQEHIPNEAKQKVINFCKEKGLTYNN